MLGIAHLMERRADQLSGGERRRVSLARALSLRAPLVLMDEPLEGLDERTYSRLLDELPPLLAAFDATTLLVTHTRQEALRLAEDLVVLVDGRVLAAGDKRAVAMNPRTAAVAEVLGYIVLRGGGRRIAVPPDGLKPGRGDACSRSVNRTQWAGSAGDASLSGLGDLRVGRLRACSITSIAVGMKGDVIRSLRRRALARTPRVC